MKFGEILLVLLALLMLAGCAPKQPSAVTTVPTTQPPATTVPETTAPPETDAPALYTPDEDSILHRIPVFENATYAEIRSLSHDGTYAKQSSLSDTVTTSDMLGGGEMLMFNGVRDDERLVEYQNELKNWGYTLYAESVLGDCRYATWTSSDTVVTLMYISNYRRLGIIVEPMRALPTRQEDNRYEDLGIENKVIMISCQFMDENNGLCAAFQLCDGSFIIVDSGHGWHQRRNSGMQDYWQSNAKELYHVLEEYSPDRDGDGDKDKDDIVVAAWFFTHPHMDHMGGYIPFAKLYADKVNVEQVVFNMPNEKITEKFTDGYIAAGKGKEITGEYVELIENTTTDYFPEAKLVEAHPGQVYYIRDAVIEMLYTWELDWNMPNRCNSLSLFFTVELGDTKILVPGDSGESESRLVTNVYKEYLKSDMQFVIHHGSTGATAMLNGYIDADVVLWPAAYSLYESTKDKEYNRPLQDADAIYVAGDKVTVITLPYEGVSSVSIRDTIEAIKRD